MMTQHENSEDGVSATPSDDLPRDLPADDYDSTADGEADHDFASEETNMTALENRHERNESEDDHTSPPTLAFLISLPTGQSSNNNRSGDEEDPGRADWMQMVYAIQGMQQSLERSRRSERQGETFEDDEEKAPWPHVTDSQHQGHIQTDPFSKPATSAYGLPLDGHYVGETVKHPGICALEGSDQLSSPESLTEVLPSLNQAWEEISDPGKVEIDSSEDSSHQPRNHLSRVRILSMDLLARSLQNRFNQTGDLASLDAAINQRRQALRLSPLEDAEQFRLLLAFTLCLQSRFYLRGDISDLHESIYYLQQSLKLKEVENDQRLNALKSLSGALDVRFHLRGELEDIDEGIICSRELLGIQPAGYHGRCDALCRFIVMVSIRFKQKGLGQDLEEAICYAREHLELHPPGHRMRPLCLSSLGGFLQTQFLQNGNFEDLEDAIRLHREALLLLPPGTSGRAWSLKSLANCLTMHHGWQGDIDVLEEAISHLRQCLLLGEEGAQNRLMYLENLGRALLQRYRCCGDNNDLNDAIHHLREAVKAPNSHPSGSLELLPKLAQALVTRFQDDGRFEDLDEAIIAYREALSSPVLPHHARSEGLGGLATALRIRYHCLRDPADLDEAISHLEDELRDMPLGNPNRTVRLNSLAGALADRPNRDQDDVEQAIAYYREVLQTRPPGHPGRAGTLHCLGDALAMIPFEDEFSNDSLDCHQEALSLTPAGHPDHPESLYNVGSSLLNRSSANSDMSDLAAAIKYFEDAVRLSQPQHTQTAIRMKSLALTYSLYGRLNGDESMFSEASVWYERAVDHDTSSVRERFRASLEWVESGDMGTDIRTLVRAYRKCLQLADRYILIKSSVTTRHKQVVSSIPQSLASDAASCAIDDDQVETAVEFLEQGRTLIWSQMGRYRTPVDSLKNVDLGLAGELEGLSRDLESAAVAFTRQDLSPTSMETEARKYRQLSGQWDATVEKIRELSGFENFLRATPFESLKEAAAHGPVIVVNISERRSDAVIIQKDSGPLVIPLQNARPNDIDRLSLELSEALLPTTTERNRKAKIIAVLRMLWDDIVGPVAEQLQEIGYTQGSRIWWCPTYKLSSLPLHAAGPYRGQRPSLLDLYVSSYTSTLTTLIKSSRVAPSVSTPLVPKLLLVAQPDVPNQCLIQSVIEEIHGIQQTVPVTDLLLDEDGNVDAVLTSLRTCRWIHFACHGTQNLQEPFQSCFHLSDKPLRLLDIIQAQLPDAEFAYSAACHSAAGDKNRPDEAIHLVAGLQFSGFKSVIGTLYAMADIDGPVMAEEVYKYLFRRVGSNEGSVDFRDAARALNLATKKLREMKVPVERWINFIHIGA